MLESLIKLFFTRWPFLAALFLIGCVGSYLVIQKYGKQSFAIEGVLTYSISDDYAQRRIFPAPKLETIMQLVKSPEVLDQAIKDLESPISIDLLMRQMRVQNSQMSDNIAVIFETAETVNSTKIVNRIMELAKDRYLKARNESFKQALNRVDSELKTAEKEHRDTMTQFRDELARLNVSDPKLEHDAVMKQVSELSVQVKQLQNLKPGLEDQITTLNQFIEEQSKPDPSQPDFNPNLTNEQQVAVLTQKGEQKIAESLLRTRQIQWEKLLPLVRDKVVPYKELLDMEQEIDGLRKKIQTLKETITLLEKKPDAKIGILVNGNGDPLGKPKEKRLELILELKALPGKLKAAEEDLAEKKKRQEVIEKASTELEPFTQATGRTGSVVSEQIRMRSELNQFRSKIDDPNTSELKIRSAGSAGPSPISSNHMKIAAAVFGLLFMLYVGYLAIFELPRIPKAAPVVETAARVPVYQQHPERFPSLAVLGHYAPPQTLNGRLPAIPSAPHAEEVHTLANGIAENFREPGSIILFTPMGDGVQVEKLVSELSRYYAKQGESVLLFDARGVSTPLSVMPLTATKTVAIDPFLDGQADDPSACFSPTQIPSVEYARGDITHRVSGGAMAMYRFRQLLEEMRHRYSRVLMIGPSARDLDDLQMLTAFSEGVVLVVQDQANPHDVNTYVEALKTSETPVFGAVVIGNQSF